MVSSHLFWIRLLSVDISFGELQTLRILSVCGTILGMTLYDQCLCIGYCVVETAGTVDLVFCRYPSCRLRSGFSFTRIINRAFKRVNEGLTKLDKNRSHLGCEQQLRRIPCPLSCYEHISRCNPSGICLRRGSFYFYVSSCLACCNNMCTQIWDANHHGSGNFLWNRRTFRSIMVHRNLAFIFIPGSVLWVGNGFLIHCLRVSWHRPLLLVYALKVLTIK